MPPDPATPKTSTRGLRGAGIVAVIGILVIVGSGLAMRASDDKRLRDWTDERLIPTVTVLEPVSTGGAVQLDLPGRLQAFSRALLYARVNGYLKSWKADIGTPVKGGQLLAEIEAPDLEQQLLQAKADLASAQATASLARTTAERWQQLVNSGYVSKQAGAEKTGDFMTKDALAKAARANVERLEALKNFTRIVAPFDGIVTARLTDIGALVNAGSGAGQELFEISNTRTLRVYVNVPQVYVPRISPGSRVAITVPERPGKIYAATVAASAQAVNSTLGTTLMQIHVDNLNGELLPGAFANINFQLPGDTAVMSLPASALIFGKNGLHVATVDADNRIVLKPVTIMRDLGKTVELASGLAPGDRVIESPPDGIADGESVRIGHAVSKRNGTNGASSASKGLY
jgi:RND family efflux transporter MFP subunit